MKTISICSTCGNPRSLLADECPFCGATDVLTSQSTAWNCYTINLENNLPTVDESLERFHVQLEKLKGTGIRLVKVIHGHGSSGTGGNIRKAFRDAMEYGQWGDAITEVYFGETLSHGKHGITELLKSYPLIKTAITKDMQGNPGITLLILSKNH